MKTARHLFLLSLGTLAIGCGGKGSGTARFEDVTPRVTATLRGFRTEDPSIQNAVVSVRVPGQAAVTVADGIADPETKAPMTDRHPFLTASVGKTMTAAVVLRFVERGRIDIDKPAAQYLAAGTMNGLHPRASAITVRQLLNHTSGIADYVEDGERDENGLSPFQRIMLSDPDHLWTPEELLEYTRENLEPVGAGWHYSDTGYVLLALIVERVSGQPFHVAMREELFDPLGMTETYMPWREPARGALPLSSVWLSTIEMTKLRTLSCDWGGGGFATTVRDLDRFLTGVLEGTAFRNRGTVARMQSWVQTGESGVEYGLGIGRYRTVKGWLTGHDGFFGAFAFRADWQGVNYVGTVNQAVTTVRPAEELAAAVEAGRK